MIKEFSIKNSGNMNLSANFKVKEFMCHDGSDKVLIDVELVSKLQDLRDYLGKPVTIVSGYRTDSYNKQCGGAENSYHLKGQAVDICCSGVKPIVIALWAEFNNLGGIGVYLNRSQEFVHIDTRVNKYRWVNKNGTNQSLNSVTDLL